MLFQNTLSFAQQLDAEDELRSFREKFHYPKIGSKETIYLTGNSLGLMPKKARDYAEQEFSDWQNSAVEAHFNAKNPWFYYHHFCNEMLAELVGAKREEVVAMGSLTANLHLLMVSFYRPTKQRYKIMMEANAFPSDQYAIESQVNYHGFSVEDAIIEIEPREGEYFIRNEDILSSIEKNKNELALVMFGGVNYLSGQFFNLKEITGATHDAGAYAGFDLAHAAGNVPLQLHDWNVDFACWCSYKYLNSGPGGVAGIFVHEKFDTEKIPRFAGWWGYEEDSRFEMKKGFVPMKGAASWQVSNAPVFNSAIHCASLEIFHEAGMDRLRKKSELLTAYLEFIVDDFNLKYPDAALNIITPRDHSQRGSQLSTKAKKGRNFFEQITDAGVIADWREPDVIRLSPVPLYNTFEEVWKVGEILKAISA